MKDKTAPTLGLCMIVKDEAHIIRRCLRAALPLVDYVLVVDTGSSDGTPELVRGFLAEHDLPGAVLHDTWRDFGSNRSFALAELRAIEWIDYGVMLDADDLLVLDPGVDPVAWKRDLTADLYDVRILCGTAEYSRPQLCRNRLETRYRGVLHEFLEAPEGASRAAARGIHIEAIQDGARNRNPRKYAEDTRVLATAAERERDPFLVARYRFYQARCHESAGEWVAALAAYRARAALGHWKEEVYLSVMGMASMLERLGHPASEVIGAYLAAQEASPGRAEAIHAAIRCCRLNGLHQTAWILARQAIGMTRPDGALFLDSSVYDWALRDEYALAAYYTGRYAESLAVWEALLSDGALPASQRKRIEENAGFARARLAPPATVSAPAVRRGAAAAPGGVPRILLAVLAKQAAATLPLYLECIEALDYPPSAIVLHVRTNDNLDDTAGLLEGWLARVGHRYAEVHYDPTPVPEPVATPDPHHWTPARFKALGRLRQQSLEHTLTAGCDFYFTADADNFLRPETLSRLVALDVPLVAPLLRHVNPGQRYANFHAAIDDAGYFREAPIHDELRQRAVPGLHPVPVVHCTYLVRRDVIPLLRYDDDSGRHEYVIFAESARHRGVSQLLDTRKVYGVIAFDEPLVLARHSLAALEASGA